MSTAESKITSISEIVKASRKIDSEKLNVSAVYAENDYAITFATASRSLSVMSGRDIGTLICC